MINSPQPLFDAQQLSFFLHYHVVKMIAIVRANLFLDAKSRNHFSCGYRVCLLPLGILRPSHEIDQLPPTHQYGFLFTSHVTMCLNGPSGTGMWPIGALYDFLMFCSAHILHDSSIFSIVGACATTTMRPESPSSPPFWLHGQSHEPNETM